MSLKSSGSSTSGGTTATVPSSQDFTVCGFFKINTVTAAFTVIFCALGAGLYIETNVAGTGLEFSNGGGGAAATTTGQTLVAGVWYFVALVTTGTGASGGAMRLYWKQAGGRSLQSVSATGLNFSTTLTGLGFGSDNSGAATDSCLNGNLAGWRYWSGVVLSQADLESESRSIRSDRQDRTYEWPFDNDHDIRDRRAANILTVTAAQLTAGDSPPVPYWPMRQPFTLIANAAAGALASFLGGPDLPVRFAPRRVVPEAAPPLTTPTRFAPTLFSTWPHAPVRAPPPRPGPEPPAPLTTPTTFAPARFETWPEEARRGPPARPVPDSAWVAPGFKLAQLPPSLEPQWPIPKRPSPDPPAPLTTPTTFAPVLYELWPEEVRLVRPPRPGYDGQAALATPTTFAPELFEFWSEEPRRGSSPRFAPDVVWLPASFGLTALVLGIDPQAWSQKRPGPEWVVPLAASSTTPPAPYELWPEEARFVRTPHPVYEGASPLTTPTTFAPTLYVLWPEDPRRGPSPRYAPDSVWLSPRFALATLSQGSEPQAFVPRHAPVDSALPFVVLSTTPPAPYELWPEELRFVRPPRPGYDGQAALATPTTFAPVLYELWPEEPRRRPMVRLGPDVQPPISPASSTAPVPWPEEPRLVRTPHPAYEGQSALRTPIFALPAFTLWSEDPRRVAVRPAPDAAWAQVAFALATLPPAQEPQRSGLRYPGQEGAAALTAPTTFAPTLYVLWPEEPRPRRPPRPGYEGAWVGSNYVAPIVIELVPTGNEAAPPRPKWMRAEDSPWLGTALAIPPPGPVYDPRVQALLDILTARASYRQLTFTVGLTTTYSFADHPFVRVRPRGPAPWMIVSWNAVYRSPTMSKPIINNIPGVGPAVIGQETYPGVEREFGLVLDPYRHTKIQDLRESVVCDVSDGPMVQLAMLQWIQTCFDQHDSRMKQGARPPGRVP